MRGIDQNDKYIKAKKQFNKKVLKDIECHKVEECDRQWSIFKEAFLDVSNYKCPICETNLDSYSDIDHIEPKVQYQKNKCCCKNYLILCPACNRAYKREQFPIEEDNEPDIVNMYVANKLLINPREDDILKYFQLYFIRLKSRLVVLYLAPKDGLSIEEKEMANATIQVYGLADCESDKMKDRCRISLLSDHYSKFIKFARARKKGIKYFFAMLEDKDYEGFVNYGFIKFIAREQFKILEAK